MAKKIPIVQLNLIHPHTTKKRKFVCAECGLSYSLRDYRLLFDNRKISYFLEEDKPMTRICHDCLISFAAKRKGEMGVPKLLIKLDLVDEEVILNFI